MPPALQQWDFPKMHPAIFSIPETPPHHNKSQLPAIGFLIYDVYLLKISASKNPPDIHSARCTFAPHAIALPQASRTDLASDRRVRAESGGTAVFTAGGSPFTTSPGPVITGLET
jgi:hypothetical protein